MLLRHRLLSLLLLRLRATTRRAITSSTKTTLSTAAVRLPPLSPLLYSLLLLRRTHASTCSSFASSDRVVRKLGEGTFGKVVEAVDQVTKKPYAVKIIRAVQKYRDASKIEIRVLKELKKGDPNNELSVSSPLSRSREGTRG